MTSLPPTKEFSDQTDVAGLVDIFLASAFLCMFPPPIQGFDFLSFTQVIYLLTTSWTVSSSSSKNLQVVSH